jgi:hypothetical protein
MRPRCCQSKPLLTDQPMDHRRTQNQDNHIESDTERQIQRHPHTGLLVRALPCLAQGVGAANCDRPDKPGHDGEGASQKARLEKRNCFRRELSFNRSPPIPGQRFVQTS